MLNDCPFETFTVLYENKCQLVNLTKHGISQINKKMHLKC